MQTPFRTSVLKYLHRVTELQMPYGSYNILTQRYTFRGTQRYVYFETRKVGFVEAFRKVARLCVDDRVTTSKLLKHTSKPVTVHEKKKRQKEKGELSRITLESYINALMAFINT